MARQISPARRAFLVHGQYVALRPEQIQRHIPADFIAVLVLPRLHSRHDLRFRRRFLPKIAADDGIELVERLEDREIQLRKKVAGKDHPAITIYHKRLY